MNPIKSCPVCGDSFVFNRCDKATCGKLACKRTLNRHRPHMCDCGRPASICVTANIFVCPHCHRIEAQRLTADDDRAARNAQKDRHAFSDWRAYAKQWGSEEKARIL